MIGHESSPFSHEILIQIGFPHALRNDGLANTYIDSSDQLFLEPLQSHDYATSSMLIRDGLSVASIVEEDGSARYLGYEAQADIITLPAILNASIKHSRGPADVTQALSLAARTLNAVHKEHGIVPNIDVIDAVAIERNTGRAEFFAPFLSSETLSPYDVLLKLRQNAISRATNNEEVRMLSNSFDRAMQEARRK